jgi:hypothetical protein
MKESYFDMSNGTNFQSDAPPSPGLPPAMSIRKAQRADYRDGRDKRSDDQVETATSFAPLTLGCAQSLDSTLFFRGISFCQNGAGRHQNLTYVNNKE